MTAGLICGPRLSYFWGLSGNAPSNLMPTDTKTQTDFKLWTVRLCSNAVSGPAAHLWRFLQRWGDRRRVRCKFAGKIVRQRMLVLWIPQFVRRASETAWEWCLVLVLPAISRHASCRSFLIRFVRRQKWWRGSLWVPFRWGGRLRNWRRLHFAWRFHRRCSRSWTCGGFAPRLPPPRPCCDWLERSYSGSHFALSFWERVGCGCPPWSCYCCSSYNFIRNRNASVGWREGITLDGMVVGWGWL